MDGLLCHCKRCVVSQLVTISFAWVCLTRFLLRWAKIRSSAGMVSFAAMLETRSTSGYLEYGSKMCRTISPVGSGPQKSADSCNHGPSGVGDIFRGSHCELLILAWQGMQLVIFLSTLLSIPGNHTFDHGSFLVFTIPRCPLWQMLMTCSCRLSGMTSWWPRVTTPI